jgi:uncharacterized protein (TIGR02466 family)
MNVIFNPANEFVLIKDLSDTINFKAIDKEFNSLKFQNNQFNRISNRLDFFDKNTFKTTKSLLAKECKEYLNGCFNIQNMYTDITLTNSWCNITEPEQAHHEHTHPFSVVSGVIYLDDNPDNLNLNFVLNNKSSQIPFFLDQASTAHVPLKGLLEMYNHNPVEHNNLKNHLVLFLSNLRHYVTPTPLEASVAMPRRSISFNTFWKGRIGLQDNPLGSLGFAELSIDKINGPGPEELPKQPKPMVDLKKQPKI